jgi:hypothetical protein
LLTGVVLQQRLLLVLQLLLLLQALNLKQQLLLVLHLQQASLLLTSLPQLAEEPQALLQRLLHKLSWLAEPNLHL